MNFLELFAGSRSFGNVAEKLGHTVFSVDWTKYEKINLVTDIEFLTKEMIPFIPDYIHASPDCTTYSIASIYRHRNGTFPITEYGEKCDRVNRNLIKLIHEFLEINPKMKYTIENPRGMFRKMDFVKNLERKTIWYCQYGFSNAKPTDIFSNNFYSIFNPLGWNPKPECFNSNSKCIHSLPGNGTQNKSNFYERSKIPESLCLELLKSNLI